MRAPNLPHRQLTGGAWAAFSAAAGSSLSLLFFFVLTRLLGPEVFGVASMVIATLAIGQTVLQGGSAEALIQLRQLKQDHAHTLFWVLQLVAAFFLLVLLLLGNALERFFSQEGLLPLIGAGSAVLFADAAGAIPRAFLRRDLRIAGIAKAEIAAELLGGMTGIVLALQGAGVWSLIALHLVTRFTEAAILFVYAGWRPRLRWSNSHLREVASFSTSRLFSRLLTFIEMHGPRFLLGGAAGAVALGLFVFGRRIMETLDRLLFSPVRSVAMPTFALLQDDKEATARFYKKGVSLTAVGVFPASAGMAVVAPLLVPLVAGEQWAAAVPVVQIFALRSLCKTLNMWNGSLLRGLGKPEWHLAAIAARTSLSLVLMFSLLSYGVSGVAWSLAIAAFLTWPVAGSFTQRAARISMPAQLAPGIPALAAASIMAVATILTRSALGPQTELWTGVAWIVAVGVAAYLLALLLLGRRQLGLLRELANAVSEMVLLRMRADSRPRA